MNTKDFIRSQSIEAPEDYLERRLSSDFNHYPPGENQLYPGFLIAFKNFKLVFFNIFFYLINSTFRWVLSPAPSDVEILWISKNWKGSLSSLIFIFSETTKNSQLPRENTTPKHSFINTSELSYRTCSFWFFTDEMWSLLPELIP